MDKRPIIGLVLIGLLTVAWITYNSSVSTRDVPPAKDSTGQAAATGTQAPGTQAPGTQPAITATPSATAYGRAFAGAADGPEQLVTVETDLVRAVISSKGGVIRRWELKQYNSWRGQPVQLISPTNNPGEMGIFFSTHEGKQIDTRLLSFGLEVNGQPAASAIRLSGADSVRLTARLVLEGGASIVKTYTLYGDRYIAGLGVRMNNMEEIVANRRYEISWTNGLKYQEYNSVDESGSSEVMASVGGDLEHLDAAEPNVKVSIPGISGAIDYTAVKTKYFTAAIIPQSISAETDVYLEGNASTVKNEGIVETYSMSYRLPLRPTSAEEQFTLYIGPIDYDIVKQYGLEATVNLGWPVIRQIGEYMMLPVLKFVHNFIPNYGFAIIIFSIIMKLLLYPLSIQQMRSAAKMKLLAPEMNRIREKHKDDMAVQQQEMMRMYGEYGINPAGGCLPLLLQMPIMYALYMVLSSSIDLRHAPFTLWIQDLSVPDVLIDLPFKLLFIDHISGLALLMGITMFIQQKQTITDPRQKAMVYMMPVMFLFMFSNLPAGLNLYYFVFNLLGIIQQVYITNFSKNRHTLEDLKRMPKKEGWLQKKMREAQEIAAAQGKTLPGAPMPPRTNGTGAGGRKKPKRTK